MSLSWADIKTGCLTLLVCPLAQIPTYACVRHCVLGDRFLWCKPGDTSILDLRVAFPRILCYSCNSWTQRTQSSLPDTAHILFVSVSMLCTNTLNIYSSVWQCPSITSAFYILLNAHFLYCCAKLFFFFSTPVPQIARQNVVAGKGENLPKVGYWILNKSHQVKTQSNFLWLVLYNL